MVAVIPNTYLLHFIFYTDKLLSLYNVKNNNKFLLQVIASYYSPKCSLQTVYSVWDSTDADMKRRKVGNLCTEVQLLKVFMDS